MLIGLPINTLSFFFVLFRIYSYFLQDTKNATLKNFYITNIIAKQSCVPIHTSHYFPLHFFFNFMKLILRPQCPSLVQIVSNQSISLILFNNALELSVPLVLKKGELIQEKKSEHLNSILFYSTENCFASQQGLFCLFVLFSTFMVTCAHY